MTGKRRPLLSPLGVRLAAAFVTVAIAAVSVLGVLSVVAARSEVSDLVADIHERDAHSAGAAAGRSYEAAGGWSSADLSPVAAIAARGQATVAVIDDDGHVIAAPADEANEMMARMHGIEVLEVPRAAPIAAAVTVDGAQVGTVELRYPASHLPTPERQAVDALARNIVVGGLFAVAVAVIVAVFVARRVTAPVTALTAAATEVGAGRRGVRVNQPDAPGELGVLSAAFDEMAAAVDAEDELRRQLVADVAHEVRTPLTILRAMTEGLVDGVVDATPDTLGSVHDEVLRLSALVGDLETLAAADAARLALQLERVDLAEIASATIDAVASTAADRQITIRSELSAAPVVADPRRVHQIVANLLVNAVRYTPKGGEVLVTSGRDEDRCFVEVADSGPGLTDDDLAHVFDRFYRGSASAATPGSGVGLAIAAALTTAHHGTLGAENRPDGGAQFTLSLGAT